MGSLLNDCTNNSDCVKIFIFLLYRYWGLLIQSSTGLLYFSPIVTIDLDNTWGVIIAAFLSGSAPPYVLGPPIYCHKLDVYFSLFLLIYWYTTSIKNILLDFMLEKTPKRKGLTCIIMDGLSHSFTAKLLEVKG